MIGLLWLVACGTGPAVVESAPVEPRAIADAECAVCGMVVAEQAAPRGQVRHRDGTHAHFCSLGDMRAYVQAPGPRGAPMALWVEQLEPGYDAAGFDGAPRPWIEAESASFVVGFERGRVMGRPALSFADPAAAAQAATAVGGRVTTWSALATTPFSQDP